MRTRFDSWFNRAGWLGAIGLALAIGPSAFAQEVREGIRRFIVKEADGEGNEEKELVISVDGEGAEAVELAAHGEYWLGLMCEPCDDALRAQLKLGENRGLVVRQVVPESPAAKAGIQKHDVVMTVDNSPVGTGADLIKMVDAGKDKELAIGLIRAGEKMAVMAKPEKRPAGDFEIAVAAPGENDRLTIRKWMERMAPGKGGLGDLGKRIRLMRPHRGIVLPPGGKFDAQLPEGMSVSINKSGKDPAKISVKKGSESWESTEDKLEVFPEDVRAQVKKMLGQFGGGGFEFSTEGGPLGLEGAIDVEVVEGDDEAIAGAAAEAGPARIHVERFKASDGGDDDRIEKLSKQIEELKQAIEALQKTKAAESK